MSKLFLLFALCLPSISNRVDERHAAFEAALDAYVDYHAFAGVVLVAQRDAILFERAVGRADRDWGVDASVDTKYQVGSVTKPMIATLAMRFVEQHVLSLDDTVTQWVPQYPAATGARITIHQLLSHTAGIPGYGHFENPREDVFRRKYSREEYLAVFQNLPLSFEPGQGFEYSGFGYYLLGVILERAGGAPLDELLRRQVFEPAGMTASLLDVGLPIPGRAEPYQYDFTRAAYRRGDDRDPTTAFAAGGVYSTVRDLFRFRRALDGGVLLAPSSVERMSTPVRGDYGYGWVVRAMEVDDGRGTVPVVLHNGGISGYTANLLWFPDDEITVVVLSNTRGYKDTLLPWVLAGIAHGDRETVSGRLAQTLFRCALREGVDVAVEEYGRVTSSDAPRGAVDIAFETNDPDTLVWTANALLQYGDAAAAVALLELNLDPFPRSTATLALLGDANASLGRTEAAIAAYRACLEIDPTDLGVARSLDALGTAAQEPPHDAPVRVLFIGNSYTYFNDLPAMFAELADATSCAVEVERVVEGAATLADHLRGGSASELIEQWPWDWVVLQEQSTLGINRFHNGRARFDGPEGFERAAEAFIELARQNGARPALLLTWARRASMENQVFLNDAFVRVAERTDAVVIPAGPAWMEALRDSPELPLYEDGAHPAPAGTYATAYCVARALLGPAFSDSPAAAFVPASVPIEADAAASIRASVDRTIDRAGPHGRQLERQTPEPFVLASPPPSNTGPDAFIGRWTGRVPILPDVEPSTLELDITRDEADGELQVGVAFRHGIQGPGAQLFPDEAEHVRARVERGRLVFEHDTHGFGTTYEYELGWRDGAPDGRVRWCSNEAPVFSATFRLEHPQ